MAKTKRLTQSIIAEVHHLSVRRLQRTARISRLAPDLEAKLRAGELSTNQAERVALERIGAYDEIKIEAQHARNAIRRLNQKLPAKDWKATQAAWEVIEDIREQLDALELGITRAAFRHMADE